MKKNYFNIENLDLKVLSVITAILLWSFIMGIENPEIVREYKNIPVEIEGIRYLGFTGLHMEQEDDLTVSVTVKGTRSTINEIKRENINASIDINGLEEGITDVPVEVDISGASRVQITSRTPENIEINLESIQSANLPIEVELIGDLEEEYVVGAVKPVNNFVRVTEPQSKIDKIDRVVAQIELTPSRKETFVSTTELLFLDKNEIEIEDISSNINATNIDVPIYKLKSVPIEPIIEITEEEEDQDDGEEAFKIVDIKVVPENVVLRGPESLIDKITYIETEPLYYNMLAGKTEISLRLVMPDGVKVHNDTDDFKMTYKVETTISKTLEVSTEDLEIVNSDEEYEYTVEDTPITIVFKGDPKDLEDITVDNLNLFVDVESLKEGKYTLDIMTDLDNIVSIDPVEVEIEINLEETEGGED